MLYYTGLEEVIFSKHHLLSEEPDELIIVSGFLGPSPIERLSELSGMKITVIGGMYHHGIDARLLSSLEKIKSNNPALTIMYSDQEIHSKIYIWRRKGKILSALIGSANFSSNGLRTDYRESLADATRDTFNPLEIYFKFVMGHSTETPTISTKQEIIDFSTPITTEPTTTITPVKRYSYDIPLYTTQKNQVKMVPTSSGLNWGLARLIGGSHTAQGDAYIRLPKDMLETNQVLLKPLDSEFTTPDGKRKRNSDPIELIWDDGTVMEASLEGVQEFNGKNYPKQLASYSSKYPIIGGKRISKKSILGRYLRNRLGVGVDEVITLETLNKYGRDTIRLSLIDEGIYYADFSV